MLRGQTVVNFGSRLAGVLAAALAVMTPVAGAQAAGLEDSFDQTFGTTPRIPAPVPAPAPSRPTAPVTPFVASATPSNYGRGFEGMLAAAASPEMGRIGVAALDLSTGRSVGVLGDQPFPMASTSKIAIVATFLDGVDRGRWSLDQMFPLMMPVPSAKFAGPVAPVRPGTYLTAQQLINAAIIRSDNQATDALLAVVGGPSAVNRWIRSAGISGMRLDRDIATLVRDDGEYNPATTVDLRDSATPAAMIRLLSGLFRGQWLSPSSRDVLMNAMENCVTGKRRIRGMLPEGVQVAHKTGTLSNTASDVGFIRTPDGRAYAVAIYVTGQGSKADRDARIAGIARTIYEGYQSESGGYRGLASRR